MSIYDPKSRVAAEFINDQEIKDTLAWAQANKTNHELCHAAIEKAAQFKGLTHREAALLLACEDKDINDKIFDPLLAPLTRPAMSTISTVAGMVLCG